MPQSSTSPGSGSAALGQPSTPADSQRTLGEMMQEIDSQISIAKEQCRQQNILFVDELGFEFIPQKFSELPEEWFLEELKKATTFVRVFGKRKTSPTLLVVSQDGRELWVADCKCEKDVTKIPLFQITELRKGQKTKVFHRLPLSGISLLLF